MRCAEFRGRFTASTTVRPYYCTTVRLHDCTTVPKSHPRPTQVGPRAAQEPLWPVQEPPQSPKKHEKRCTVGTNQLFDKTSFRSCQERPKTPQELPKSRQERPRSRPRATKSAPGGPRRAPGGPKSRPRAPLESWVALVSGGLGTTWANLGQLGPTWAQNEPMLGPI